MGPKLLLINPVMPAQRMGRRPDNGRRIVHAGGLATMEPLALGYVAAATPSHWTVRIADEVSQEIPSDFEPDLVGLTSLSITAPRAYEIAGQYRARGIPVVMGGVHATLMPREAQYYVDVVFQGEAERQWPTLIRDFERKELQPRYFGGATSLQNLPQPARGLYGHRHFLHLVSASRGCRYRCEFCSLWKLEGGRYRARPPQDVFRELETIGGRRPILFTDENIYADREWALALFGGLAERGSKHRYAVQASLDIADDVELLTALQHSGCMTVLIGFESVNESSLRQMRKGVNLRIGVAHYKEKVAKLHDHGLASSGTFIFGNDGDGPDVFERTAELVLDAGIDLAHFGLLTPNPGTDLFDRLEKEGRLLYTNFPQDYARYDLVTAVFRPQNMTVEQLEEGLQWTTRAVGSRSAALHRAWNTFWAIRDPLVTAVVLGWNRTGLYNRVVT